MNEIEFLQRSAERLSGLIGDRGFQNERSQLRAKALLRASTVIDSTLEPHFTFREERLWRNCEYILESVVRQVLRGDGQAPVTKRAAELAAETTEYLARVADQVDRQQAAITSSLLYHLAGYEANGICLARTVLVPGGQTDADHVYWHNIALFLLRRLRQLRIESGRALEMLRDQDEQVVAALDEGSADIASALSLAAQIHVQRSLGEIATFGLEGDDGRYRVAIEELGRGLELLTEIGDVRRSIVARALGAAFTRFRQRSTWDILRADAHTGEQTWHNYLLALATGDPRDPSARSIVEFWPSQRTALDAGLLEGHRSFVVQMPTSAGKTRIAELAIVDALVRTPGSHCIYVAPFKALAQEVEQALGRTVGQLGYRVSTIMGSFETDEFENYLISETDVLITTPEKLDLLFRWQPDYFDNVSLVILDEGHIVDEVGRGPKYELLLTKIKRRAQRRGLRFLFVSAVMSEQNGRQFAAWLAVSGEGLITTSWRPARQLLAAFTWGQYELSRYQRSNRGWLTYVQLAEHGQQAPFVPGVVERREMIDYTPKRHSLKRVPFPERGNRGQTAAELAFQFADQGQVLIFCSQTNWVRSVANALLEGLRLREQSDFATPVALQTGQSCASLELAREWLGEEHILFRALDRGIGIHYGPLPEAVRHSVEDDYRRSAFRVLVCTNTLAQGVNLPVTTAIVHSVSRRLPEGGEDIIKVRDYWNICGRAGRAGVDTQGQIVHIVESSRDRTLFNIYADRRIEPVESRLLVILRELAADRISTEGLRALLDADLLAVLVEEAVVSPNRADIEAILGDSLVKIQADDAHEGIAPLVDGLTAVGQSVYQRVTDPDRRKVFASTGLSIDSCERIEGAILAARAQLETAIANDEVRMLVRLTYAACEPLREMQADIRYDGEVLEFLEAWISGQSIRELWPRFVSELPERSQTYERLSQFVEKLFAYLLPWGFNAYLRIAGYLLGEPTTNSTVARYLASMTKFGLPDHVACWARSLGVPTRGIAIDLARGYRDDGGSDTDFLKFMRWLVTLTAEDLSHRFGIHGHFLESVMAQLNRVWTPTEAVPEQEVSRVEFEVRGLQYEGRSARARGIIVGESLILKREPDNQYDPNAINVMWADQSIGYVAREVARTLARELDLGRSATTIVTAVTMVGVSPSRITAVSSID